MAILNFLGMETGDLSELSTTGGTIAAQSSVVRSGTYALSLTMDGSFAFGNTRGISATGNNGVYNEANIWLGNYFRFSAIPTSQADLVNFVTSTSSIKLTVGISSSGKILAVDPAGTIFGTGTTTLLANTWYLIEVLCGTGTTANWEIKINGISEISGTHNLLTVNNAGILYGANNFDPTDGTVFYVDDIIISNSSYVGAQATLLSLPTAEGFYTAWTASSGTKVSCVNTVPQDGDTAYISDTVVADAETFTMQSSATVGVSGTINSVKGTTFPRRFGAGASSYIMRMRNGSTDSDNSALTTGAGYVNNSRLLNTDPNTGSAWTTSGFDTIQVGGVNNNVGGNRVTGVYAMVNFTAGSGPSVKTVGFAGFSSGGITGTGGTKTIGLTSCG